jgi:outer membrane protein assembly factor BamB
VVGDFNRDGKPDVATANETASSISVLLGDGSGIALLASAASASSATDIVAGDLDRDGRLDLVVASGDVAEVAVHQGQDAGAFADFVVSDTTIEVVPSRLALGDLDGDGRLDLVVVSEADHRVRVLRGDGTMDFDNASVLADLSLGTRAPAAAATGDFDHDGDLDLAVAARAANRVEVFLNDGGGVLTAGPTATVGNGPGDVSAGDVNGDGRPDLVTANGGSPANVSVLIGTGGGAFAAQDAVAVGGQPTRAALVDLDGDGALDLVVLDAAAPRLAAFEGGGVPPAVFGTVPYAASLGAPPRGLALGDFTSDGRADLVTVLSSASQAVVVPNESGWPCVRSSFGDASRSHAVPSGPVATAAADFDRDGRVDLAVATFNDARIRILRGEAGDFVPVSTLPNPFSSPPRGLATADFDFDGQADLVAALGDASAGRVQLILRDAVGGFTIGPSLPAGLNTAAVSIGDFDGNGAPDVAAVSETSGGVWVFLGDGTGGLLPVTGNPVLSGLSTPRALVAADLTGDGLADIAVAESGGSAVHVLRSNGGGTPFFTRITPEPDGLTVGSFPEGIAVANLDTDAWPDLVTADGGGTVSVIRRGTGGSFPGAEPYPVGGSATALALVDLAGEAKPDIAVTAGTAGDPTLTLLVNDGNGLFVVPSPQTSYIRPVRRYPRAVTPLDADADGRLDLAVPCQNADSVVILLSRPSGPFSAAPWVELGVGAGPRGAVAADLDADGDLDLAVANRGANTVSLLKYDAGSFTLYRTLLNLAGPESIVAADFNRDGRVDLAVNSPLATPDPGVSILLGSSTTAGEFGAAVVVPAGAVPDALAAGDFDRDGIPDLAVCDKSSSPSNVRILLGDGSGGFPSGSSVAVGSQPTAVVAADFDGDGDLDLAVGNEGADNVQVLRNDGGDFSVVPSPLALPGTDRDPLSLAAGDFDGDGDPDLAVAAFGGDRIHVYRNNDGVLDTDPSVSLDAPSFLYSVTVADVNVDGRLDLLAVATGLTIFRGSGGMGFEPAETVLAGRSPWAAAVGDFNRDGRPDVAVANEESNDVSLLLSSSCQARRLEVAVHPAACETGPLPYGPSAEVRAYDEGGNVATCAAGTVVPSIAPGTGDPLATLGGSGVSGLPLTAGAASFTGLTIDRPGRRYRLQFTLGAAPPVQTRSFTLGPELQILGVPSMCYNGSPSTFTTEGPYDEYTWTLTPATVPPVHTPSATLLNPPVTGAHVLTVSARVDGCYAQASIDVFGGDLDSTSLSLDGYGTVCVDCIGGTIKPADVGGGPAVSRQWGYRTVSGGAVTDMPGETGPTYVVKGASFPGPGTYHVVVRTTPTCGDTKVSTNEIPVTVVSSVPTGEVQHLAASSRGTTAGGGENRLQWVNSTASASEVRVLWNKAPGPASPCLSPASTEAPFQGEYAVTTPPALPTVSSFLHTDDGGAPGLDFDTNYCYSVFVKVGTAWSPGRTVKARPFNSETGAVKWAYATGATAVVPPVVGKDGILVMSNDRTLHAITRGGASGGVWPSGWVPYALTGVAHSRSPVVPFADTSPVFPNRSILFAGDDAGDVHAVDASNGQPVWPARPQGKPVMGAPGGFFTQYWGVADLILVGTRDGSGPNELRGLAVADGSPVGAPFTAGGTIGAISGSPAIDYSTQRAYFASRSLGGTQPSIWCVQVDGSTPFVPCPGWTSRNLGHVDGSPVLRSGRVYFGTEDGTVYSLDAATGLDERTFATGDGPVKGFLFPDRRNDDLIFATNTKVWSLSDTGASTMPWNWQWTVAGLSPSLVLFWPQTNLVYVGGDDGKLYQLDFTSASQATPPSHQVLVLGDGLGQVGAPTLDIGVAPPDVAAGKKLLVVGGESGVLYGVEVPF